VSSRNRQDVGLYKIGSFSERSGVSATVLRAWERRHQLLKPERLEGGHRLYTEQDLKAISRINELLAQGRSIGEIAAIGRAALLAEKPPQGEPETNQLMELQDRMLRAAENLDNTMLNDALDLAFSKFSSDLVLSQIVEPVATEIGVRWSKGSLSIASEHLVTASLTSRIRNLRQSLTAPHQNAAVVVCGTFPGEHHELGILILSLHIERAGHRVAYLGRDLPLRDLMAASDQLNAKAVCLSVKRTEMIEYHQEELVRLSRQWKGRTRLHLGGPGTANPAPILQDSELRLWSTNFDLQEFLGDLFW
jgi:DNA-binding transcriptional MerR regulator